MKCKYGTDNKEIGGALTRYRVPNTNIGMGIDYCEERDNLEGISPMLIINDYYGYDKDRRLEDFVTISLDTEVPMIIDWEFKNLPKETVEYIMNYIYIHQPLLKLFVEQEWYSVFDIENLMDGTYDYEWDKEYLKYVPNDPIAQINKATEECKKRLQNTLKQLEGIL